MGEPKPIKIVPAGMTEIRLPTPSGHVDVRLLEITVNGRRVRGRVAVYGGTVIHTEDFPYDVASRIASGEVEVVK